MKVKAVIMKPDRTNDIVILKTKQIEAKTFRHDGVTYFLDPDRFMVTWVGRGFGKRYYSTFYYTYGHSQPLPVPDFDPILRSGKKDEITKMESKLKEDGKTPEEIKMEVDKYIKSNPQTFSGIVDNGIPGPELAAIFNPWFYRIIAQQLNDAMKNWQMILLLALCAAMVYLIWQFANFEPVIINYPEAPTTPTPGAV